MSVPFTPNKGDRFHVTFKPRERVINDLAGGMFTEAKVVKSQDRSYCDDIFECAGCDETVVVGKFLTRGPSGDIRVFRFTDCTFTPVGPDVVESLGLGEHQA